MQKFIAIFMLTRAEIDSFMSLSEDERKAKMGSMEEAWQAWLTEHKDHVVDEGSIFGRTKRVTESGVEDVKNELTGYMIVQAESHDEAVKMFENHPQFTMPGSSIDIMSLLGYPS